MPNSPYLVELISPDNAQATTILPNGQHYTRHLDETTGALATTALVWDHDVEAMKAAGFRDPEELGAAQQVHAAFPTQPEQEPEQEPEPQDAQQLGESAQAAAPTTGEVAPEPAPEPQIAPESAPEPQAEQQRGRGRGRG